jgi:type IV pilus assembly protein PilC
VIVSKPIYIWPFIFAYKLVLFPLVLVNYFLLGFFFVFYVLIDIILSTIIFIITMILSTFLYSCKGAYHFTYLTLKWAYFVLIRYPLKGLFATTIISYKIMYYFFYALSLPFLPLVKLVNKMVLVSKEKSKLKKEEAEKKYEEKRLEYEKKRNERLKKEEELKNKRLDIIEDRKKRRELDNYENENVVIEKKTFGDKINDSLQSVINIPSGVYKKIMTSYNNSTFVRNIRNKRDLEREALLISFQAEEDDRSNVKQMYEYTAKDPDGKLVKGYFDAYSRVEVHSFLLSEGFEVYSIKTSDFIRLVHGSSGAFKTKIKTTDLIFFLTQLSTYIKAGIPLVDSLKILANQFKNKGYQRVFRSLIYDLTMGDSFSEALSKQGESFPRILINMAKAAEMTGQLPEVLDDMSAYFTQIDKTKKQMVTVMMYPMVIMFVAIAVIVFILLFVIPRFVQIYESMDSSQIPAFTQFIINTSAFLRDYWILILAGVIVLVFMIVYLYKNVKLIKTFFQWIMMRTPGFGNIIIYNEVTMFSKTFSSLLSHNVFITESMDILNKITNNEIYKMLILDTITNLARGDKISDAFKNHWAFPMPAYEMIVTGEKTGELPEMMDKVSSYYQELHSNAISRLKTMIEPALIVFLTVVVGGIVLAIIVPMFNLYQSIQS